MEMYAKEQNKSGAN